MSISDPSPTCTPSRASLVPDIWTQLYVGRLRSPIQATALQRKSMRCTLPVQCMGGRVSLHHARPTDVLPWRPEEDKTWMKTWNGISLVIEVKVAQDPIDEDAPWPHIKHGENATGVLIQLAKSARNTMPTAPHALRLCRRQLRLRL